MAAPDLHSPEHPNFPRDAEKLQDPRRPPTDHEQYILNVVMRFKTLPDFAALPKPTVQEKDDALRRLEELERMPKDPISDQDDRVLALALIIADYPSLFGQMGCYLAAQILSAVKTVETSEFRRAFIREYLPALPGLRDYLKRLATLRRRGRSAKYDPNSVPKAAWGTPERRAAAREQMELVQGLADYYLMEKYWRMLEIVGSYPDFFTKEQFDQLTANAGIEQTWRAHLAKARDDWNYYKTVVNSGTVVRQVVDSAIGVLREIIRTTFLADRKSDESA
jgi:hypothetical protein